MPHPDRPAPELYLTIDHIHVINQIVEKSAQYSLPLCMAFIDYEKAFDSVKSSAVMQALMQQLVDEL